MKLKIAKIYLQPFSRFHFGQMKMDHDLSLSDTDSFCRSDTLFAGLVNSYAKANEVQDVATFVKFFEEGLIKHSSLFYFIEKANTEPIFLLPKPSFLTLHIEKKADGSHKRLNKIEFVSLKVWQQGLKIKEWLDSSEYRLLQNKILITTEEFEKMGLNEKDKIFDVDSRPKNNLEKPKTEIYYQTDVVLQTIKDGTIGLYFFYQCHDKNTELALKNALNILTFTGFGGEINIIGRTPNNVPVFGQEVEIAEKENFSNLSLYNPADMDEFKDCQYYETVLRGGRRKTDKVHTQVVRMVEEGALFKSNRVKGRMVSLGTHEDGNTTIYRNGIPLLIPIDYEHE